MGEPPPNLCESDWKEIFIWPAAPDRLTSQMLPSTQARYVRGLLEGAEALTDKICHAFRASGAQGAAMAGCDAGAIAHAGRWRGGANEVLQIAYIGLVVPSVGLALADQSRSQQDFVVHRMHLPLEDMGLNTKDIFPWIEEQEAAVSEVRSWLHAQIHFIHWPGRSFDAADAGSVSLQTVCPAALIDRPPVLYHAVEPIAPAW